MNLPRHPVPPLRWLLALLLIAGGLSPAPAYARPAVPVAAGVTASNAPIRPDPTLTPGDTLDVTLEDIRTVGYSAKVRDVPVAVKRQVYASYGIAHWTKGEYEMDHLIPLSLGGSNSAKNLWPESYLTSPWNAHVKDALEYRLLTLVRAGKVDLKVAQQEMARDWIAAYKKYVGPEPGGRWGTADGVGVNAPATVPGLSLPASPDRRPDLRTGQRGNIPAAPTPAVAASVPTAAGQPTAKVWVNTKSGVYHGPKSRYYGKTKQGQYMSEAEALAAGFHAAPGNE